VAREGHALHFRVQVNRFVARFVPIDPAAWHLILAYVAVAGHADQPDAPLFRPPRRKKSAP
jgi:hypothetical protein